VRTKGQRAVLTETKSRYLDFYSAGFLTIANGGDNIFYHNAQKQLMHKLCLKAGNDK
jgi:hypothetical protein